MIGMHKTDKIDSDKKDEEKRKKIRDVLSASKIGHIVLAILNATSYNECSKSFYM